MVTGVELGRDGQLSNWLLLLALTHSKMHLFICELVDSNVYLGFKLKAILREVKLYTFFCFLLEMHLKDNLA